jgi:GTPase
VNHSDTFHASELIREKILLFLQQEIPYSIFVEIEKIENTERIVNIHALIWVEREGQKAIVIGDKGEQLKQIGTRARHDLERHFNKKVCLKLWVKVKDNWSDDVKALANMGIGWN